MSIMDHEGFPGRREPAGPEGRRADAPAGLYFSRQGHWFHDGDRIFHEGLAGLLNRSVTRDASGALIVTTGRDRLTFVAEDAPLLLTRCAIDNGLVVSSTRGDAAPVSVVVVGADRRWRAPIGDLWGLMTRGVTQQLEALVDDDGAGGLVLRCGASLVPIREHDADWSAPPALS